MLFGTLFKRAITKGRLTVVDADDRVHAFGPGGRPSATIRLHDHTLDWQLLLDPWLRAGEAYVDGRLTVDDGQLYDAVELLMRNAEALSSHLLQRLASNISHAMRRWQQNNPISLSRQHVEHHYDLSRELFELFLDRDMHYSCAYFPSPDTDLEQAQQAKVQHIAAKLCLEPGLRVLDIGCGWGGLACALARFAEVEVLGLTLSTEQLAYAKERAACECLDQRVRFDLRDYREQDGSFDRIVSVGMFEHVGAHHYPEYFGAVDRLLRPRGIALLHTIGRRDPPGITNPWLRKYIFPGGYCPALSEVAAAIEASGLWITDVEPLRLHYAETLRHWRRRFDANRERVRQLYDDRFVRLWELYLVGCELSFRVSTSVVFQIQMAHEVDALPLTRDYILEDERLLAAVDRLPSRPIPTHHPPVAAA